MAPRKQAPKDRDQGISDRGEETGRIRRINRSGGEGSFEELVQAQNCPVCGRPCE